MSQKPIFAKAALAACASLTLTLTLAACAAPTSTRPPTESLLTPAVLPTSLPNGENAPMQPPDAANGALIYAEKCAACHGASGKGDGPRAAEVKAQGSAVVNLVDNARRRAAKPSEWHSLITVGRVQKLMPGFNGSLDAQQRWDVQSYVWSLGVVSATLTQANAVYAAQCASCHGPAGEVVTGTQALNDARFLSNNSLLDIANGMAAGDAHSQLGLSEADRLQVADAVRALGYRYSDPAQLSTAGLEGNGVLGLQAENATAGGPVPSNLPVTLRAYDAAAQVLTRTAQIGPNGLVTFTNLPTRTDYFYQAEMEYEGGRFYAVPMQFPITVTEPITGILPVYETITDSNQISIGELHLFVQSVNEGTITVVEFYQFDNASDRAYIGDGTSRRSLKISLPKDAQNLRFDGLGIGTRFEQDGELIWDTDVVVPGQGAQRVTMIYEVPYRNGREFEREVFYPVKLWDVILPETTGAGTPLLATGLTDRGKQQMTDGTSVLLYAGAATQAASTLKFQLTGQPLGAAQPGADPRAIGFGLIALGLAVGVGYFLYRRVSDIRAAYDAAPAQREKLLRQIAQLDDKFAAGKVKERDYRKQRDQLKDDLRDIWDA